MSEKFSSGTIKSKQTNKKSMSKIRKNISMYRIEKKTEYKKRIHVHNEYEPFQINKVTLSYKKISFFHREKRKFLIKHCC